MWLGDCLDLMAHIPSGSVDMVLCDLPYGTTACAWDSVIPFEPLWREYWRVCKPNAAVVLTSAQPFTSALVMSAVEQFKYCWIWHKSKVSGFTNAKNKPLNTYEDICVFSQGTCANLSDRRMNYFPQDLVRVDKKVNNSSRDASKTIGNRPSRSGAYVQEFTGYPRNVLEIPSEGRGFHPTQKPVALFEYLIRTYTDPGALVLDNTAGSGTTAIAAEQSGRRWVCIERDPTYYWGAVERMARHLLNAPSAHKGMTKPSEVGA